MLQPRKEFINTLNAYLSDRWSYDGHYINKSLICSDSYFFAVVKESCKSGEVYIVFMWSGYHTNKLIPIRTFKHKSKALTLYEALTA